MDKITVVDTYVKADVNRGTFYKYYRDVPDLYDKTEDSLVKEIYALLENTNRTDKMSQCQAVRTQSCYSNMYLVDAFMSYPTG